MLTGRRVLLGVTGGVAAYKSAILVRHLTRAGAEVTVVMTEAATRFVGPQTFAALTGRPVHTSLWERPGEVLHVRLAHEAELAVVVPATANLLAKLAHGLADDLLTATLLEYAGPLVVAPAMHTGMWMNPSTRANVEMLTARGVRFVGPVEGELAHGDEGMGRVAEPDDVLAAVAAAAAPSDLAGRRFLVTAGSTHEPVDPVRFVGNRSSGMMGVAVAAEARGRGASVTLVLGPGTVPPPPGVEVVRIETAEQLRRAVVDRVQGHDALVMAAAVADFRPKVFADAKLKKELGPPEIVLEPTPDVLAEVTGSIRPRVVVGFAAETGDVEREGRRKLRAKGVDLLVANLVGRDGTGFGSATNEATILTATGDDAPMRTWAKAELATAICDRIARMLERAP